MGMVRFLWVAAFLVSCSSTPEGSRDDSVRGLSKPPLQQSDVGSSQANEGTAMGGTPSRAPRADSAILVELFTSQGCSSCPPADALLGSLDDKLQANVIPLSFHVDYWNYIGWQDPYSSKRWSARQKKYAKRISNGRGYTPQLVVNGAGHAVGSRLGAIKEVVRQSKNTSLVGIEGAFTTDGDAGLEVFVQTTLSSSVSVNLMVALYESGLQTSVPRGENRGRTLQNDFVVRELRDLGALAQGVQSHSVAIAVDHDWQRENLGVVVFAQDTKSLRVVGVQRLQSQ